MDTAARSQGFQRLLALHDWYLRLTPDEAEILRTEVRDLLAEVDRLQVLGDTMADRLSMIGEAYDHDGTNLVRQWRQGR